MKRLPGWWVGEESAGVCTHGTRCVPYDTQEWPVAREDMQRYAVVVEDAGDNWAAYVPDLPGCVATADSPEELGRLIREAIALHLEGLAEDGLPAPEPSSRVEYVEVDG